MLFSITEPSLEVEGGMFERSCSKQEQCERRAGGREGGRGRRRREGREGREEGGGKRGRTREGRKEERMD